MQSSACPARRLSVIAHEARGGCFSQVLGRSFRLNLSIVGNSLPVPSGWTPHSPCTIDPETCQPYHECVVTAVQMQCWLDPKLLSLSNRCGIPRYRACIFDDAN